MFFFQKESSWMISCINTKPSKRYAYTALAWLLIGLIIPSLIIAPLWWQILKLRTLQALYKKQEDPQTIKNKIQDIERQTADLKKELQAATPKKKDEILSFLSTLSTSTNHQTSSLMLAFYRPHHTIQPLNPPRVLYELGIDGSIQDLILFLKNMSSASHGYTLESISLPKIPGRASIIIGSYKKEEALLKKSSDASAANAPTKTIQS